MNVEDAVERFVRAFGHDPDGVWSAPGRVNLIGEYTDLNEGYVLPLALPFRAAAAVALSDDAMVRVSSAQYGPRDPPTVVEAPLRDLRPGTTAGWTGYVLGVVWALMESGARLRGLEIQVDSEVPIGAGLSSSAALECSVALALRDLHGLPLDLLELAAAARRAENEYVGVPTGIMDQTASLCCSRGHALFLDTRTLEMRHVPFRPEQAGAVLLVVNTGVKHALGDSAYAQRRRDCERAAHELGVAALRDVPDDAVGAALDSLSDPVIRRRARHVLTEQRRVLEVVALLDSARTAAIGPLLTEGHNSLRDDFEVSSEELDTVVDAALGAGALGGRMTGGGFGGSALVLSEIERVAAVTEAIREAFAVRGWRLPEPAAVTASGGAEKFV